MQISFAAPAVQGSSGKLGGGGLGGQGADAGRGQGRQGQRRRLDAGAEILPLYRQIRANCWRSWRPQGLGASRILLVGLGKPDALDAKRAGSDRRPDRGAGWKARAKPPQPSRSKFPRARKVKSGEAAAHLAFGARLRSYGFDKYRTRNLDEYKKHLQTVTVATSDAAAARRAYAGLEAVADGIFLARDLVNEPPNVLYPAEFARRAKALSKLGVKVEVLGEAEMKKQGFGALLGVGQGSARESQLVVMQWNGARKKGEPVAFVGKGVCFDSGGLSLKPGAGMMGMKGDMGGAAAVTGAMMALATRKARVNAVGVIGLVENMPDGDAIRPDDVLNSLSGQTIEVLNTDAEGRLVLADALTYTQRRFKPQIHHRSGDPDRRHRADFGLRACRRLLQ